MLGQSFAGVATILATLVLRFAFADEFIGKFFYLKFFYVIIYSATFDIGVKLITMCNSVVYI